MPGIIRWPGKIAPGKVIDQPAYSADIMPTLCALTGADPGKPYGENLLPVLLGKSDTLTDHRPLVWTGGGYGGQVAVRIGDMKAIRKNLDPSVKQGPFDWEVYDLSKDRAETADLSATRRDVVEQAIAVLKEEYTRDPAYPELGIFSPESGLKDPATDRKPVSKPESDAPAKP